jgi:antitoxin (DNA-binding transcriptional repressor) of toxin-antitoxin stability system
MGATRKKMVVKVHHAKKSLQLLDILRGGSRVCLAVGTEPAAKIVCPRISKVGKAKTHFS